MNSRADILIVGGGAIGLCAAHYLLKKGAKVVVVDKGAFGHGSSLHNAGYICPSHFVPIASPGQFSQALRWMFDSRSPLYVKLRLDGELFAWSREFRKACKEARMRRAMPLLRDLLLDSAHLIHEMSLEEGMAFHLTNQGLCMLFATERGEAACRHEAGLADEVGITARILAREELCHMDPGVKFTARGGLFFPGDSHLVPAKFMDDLAASLSQRGAQLLSNCAVQGFSRSGSRLSSVSTSRGEIAADEFVLAGGAWSTSIVRDLGIRLLMQAGKGYSITVSRPPVNPVHPYIFYERRVAVTPFQDSLRFAGTMEIAGVNESITRPRVEAILDAIPFYFGNIARPSLDDLEPWAGMRPVSPDGLPYIGRFHQVSNLIAATGHAMLGISLSAVTGKLVAEIAGGETPSHDLGLLSPNRFD